MGLLKSCTKYKVEFPSLYNSSSLQIVKGNIFPIWISDRKEYISLLLPCINRWVFFSSANSDRQKSLLGSWCRKEVSISTPSQVSDQVHRRVLSVLKGATPLREVLIPLDTLIFCAVTFLPLEINYFHFFIMNSVFKRMFVTLYLELLCILLGECWSGIASLPYLCKRENVTHLCFHPP